MDFGRLYGVAIDCAGPSEISGIVEEANFGVAALVCHSRQEVPLSMSVVWRGKWLLAV